MKIATLIKKLEKIQSKKGNVKVFVYVDGYDCEVESVALRERFDEDTHETTMIYLGRTIGIDN